MNDHEGLLEHMDRTGKPCVYCGEPSVQTLIVRGSPAKGSPDVRVGLCEAHRREPEPPLKDKRRSPAKGVEQTRFPV